MTTIYEVDPHCAELYDQAETYTDDASLLLEFIGARQSWSIFEPFCGTGRLLVPLAEAGHRVTGLDRSRAFLDRCQAKLDRAGRTGVLMVEDALAGQWPAGFDLVVLGANCLYELESAEEQADCIAFAAGAINPGGHLFLDSNHMEGGLDPAWQDPAEKPCFPTGICADGFRLESTISTTWCDVPRRLVRFRRKIRVTSPRNEVFEHEFLQQKHPVCAGEVVDWVTQSGLCIERLYGSRKGETYTPESPRLIVWACKTGG